MRTLLIELGTEELPAAACRIADSVAQTVLARLLAEHRLAAETVDAYVSARRIAVVARGVPDRQTAERIEHRGPPERVARDGKQWTAAGAGFARRHGLGSDALVLRDGFAWLVVDAPQAGIDEVCQRLVDGFVAGLEMPKNMRWAAETLRFSRPIRTLCVLHGATLLPALIAGVPSSRRIRGHRLVAPSLTLDQADRYVEALAAAGVTVPTASRRDAISAALAAEAARLDADFTDPRGVLDELQYLVERVHVVAGRFPDRFLALPDRVLVTAMQTHQRYLPLDRAGTRIAGFLAVCNSDPADDDTVRAGNERVLTGRLDDAAFSVAKDTERGLEAMAAGLDRITFHARAGTLADKTSRVTALVDHVTRLASADPPTREHALEAARLAKADQASLMVQEFAELEGYVGEVYARAAAMPESVCVAIGEQFLPDRADGAVPGTLPGAALALADKLDTLVTTLAIGERPTGSRDPYGLRRAAAGVVAISLDRAVHLDLDEAARLVYRIGASQAAEFVLDADTAARTAKSFVLDRVDTLLVDEGVPIDLVRASRGASGASDPLAHAQRARTLTAAADTATFADAQNAFTRSSRLAARHSHLAGTPIDPATLVEDAERQLEAAVRSARRVAAAAAAAHDYHAVLAAAASLSGPVDVFFDAVLVMHDDPAVRNTRLRLLIDVTETCRLAGDLSLVQR